MRNKIISFPMKFYAKVIFYLINIKVSFYLKSSFIEKLGSLLLLTSLLLLAWFSNEAFNILTEIFDISPQYYLKLFAGLIFVTPIIRTYKMFFKPIFSINKIYPLLDIERSVFNLFYRLFNANSIYLFLTVLVFCSRYKYSNAYYFIITLSLLLSGFLIQNIFSNLLANPVNINKKQVFFICSLFILSTISILILFPVLQYKWIILFLVVFFNFYAIRIEKKFHYESNKVVDANFTPINELSYTFNMLYNNSKVRKILLIAIISKIYFLFVNPLLFSASLSPFYKAIFLSPYISLFMFYNTFGVFKNFWLLAQVHKCSIKKILAFFIPLPFFITLIDFVLFFMYAIFVSKNQSIDVTYYGLSILITFSTLITASTNSPYSYKIENKAPLKHQLLVGIAMLLLLGLAYIEDIFLLLAVGGISLFLIIIVIYKTLKSYDKRIKYKIFNAVFQ